MSIAVPRANSGGWVVVEGKRTVHVFCNLCNYLCSIQLGDGEKEVKPEEKP